MEAALPPLSESSLRVLPPQTPQAHTPPAVSEGWGADPPVTSESWNPPRVRTSKRSTSGCSKVAHHERHLSGLLHDEETVTRYLSHPLALPRTPGGNSPGAGEHGDLDDHQLEQMTSSAQVGAAFWASELPEMGSTANPAENPKADAPTRTLHDQMHKFREKAALSLLAIFAYIGLIFVWGGKGFLPYDSFFAIVVLWVGSMTGGQLAKLVGLPQLLGMLCSGIIVKNCGDLVRGLPDKWAAAIRAFGLMNILIRGGLEMDVGAVKRVGWAVVRLTVAPGVSEAFAVAALGMLILDCPFPLALATGFIIAAVSPAVVVGGMFNLQARGFGVKKGIPSLVVAAASFDDVVAISGFSMCIGLAIGSGNVLIEALHGPINIIAGIFFGFLGAAILSATTLWNVRWKRSLALLLLGVIFTFSSKVAHFSGAGALASLVMAAASAHLWSKGLFKEVSQGEDHHAAHDTEADMCFVWRLAAEPLLFSVIGSALDFRAIDVATIPKAIGIILGGVIVRTTAALFATYGAGLSWKERAFIALAWMPKATVQAALGSVPLDMARQNFDRADDPDKYDRYEKYGIAILTTAVFSILITAPVGLIVIQKLGPRWLDKLEEDLLDYEDASETSENKEDLEAPSYCAVVPAGAPHEAINVTDLADAPTSHAIGTVQVVEIDGADLAAGAGAGM